MKNKSLLRLAFGVSAVVLLVLLPLLGCAKEAPPAAPPTEPEAKIYEYYIAISGDYSGPYADVMPRASGCYNAFIDYWNDTTGKDIGVKLITKIYETRYDPAMVASVWPGVKEELNPLTWLGIGGPDVAALRERLPDDKIPMTLTTGVYGFMWTPMSWIVQYRPTYVHEGCAWVDWYLKNEWKEDRPLRVATIAWDGTPAYTDGVKGFENAWETTFAGKVEYVGCGWVDYIPADVTDVVRPLINDGADVFYMMTNVPQAVALRKACITLGKPDIPTGMATHQSIGDVHSVLPWEEMENMYEYGAIASPLDKSLPAYTDVWAKYCPAELDVDEDWTLVSMQFAAAARIFTSVVEKAVADVGPDKLSGEVWYNTLQKTALTEEEMLGLTGPLAWEPAVQNFPKVETLRLSLGAVKNGEHVLIDKSIPAVDIPKWAD